MRNISTSCALCSAPLTVSIWAFLPPPTDIYCSHCGGRNNTAKTSAFVATATLFLFVVVGAYLAAGFEQPEKNAFYAGGMIGSAFGCFPAAFLASRFPRLVPYSRWWIPRKPILNEGDSVVMEQHGIEFNGEYFAVGELHFSSLQEAVHHVLEKRRDAV